MAGRNYSEEFRRQAVDLCESHPGATVRGIAEDLGIVLGTLRQWLEAYGTGKKTAADGTLTTSPLQTSRPSPRSSPSEAAAAAETRECPTMNGVSGVHGVTGSRLLACGLRR